MRKRTSSLLLAVVVAAALFCVAYPLYVIRPFRMQGARELALALAFIRYRLFVLGLAAGIAIAVALVSRRVLAAVAVVVVGGCAALAWVNLYEKLFHPIERPEFAAAGEMKLEAREMVIAVAQGGESRAYPIRSMSYHHVLNDALSGVPIVATY
jgi:hypothetical protein